MLAMVKVAEAATSTVPVTLKEEGIVKLQALVPLPTIIFEPVPDTVQSAPIVGVALFRILKIWLSAVKLAGCDPPAKVISSVQLPGSSRLPVAFE